MSGSIIGDVFVPLFFVAGAGAALFMAYRFLATKNNVFRTFGAALGCFGLTFAIWSVAVFTKSNIDLITTLGIIPLVIGLFLSLLTGTQGMKESTQKTIVIGAAIYFAVLFILRLFFFHSTPSFSENGLYYFNAHPVVVAMYIGAFAGALLPAVNAVAGQMKDATLKTITRVGFTAIIIGGVVLVSSLDDDLQTINGWIMGIAFVSLIAAYASRQVR